MGHTTLVSTSLLATNLDDQRWVICDCRHDLADPGAGRRAYLAAHIPSARFVSLDSDLAAQPTGKNGRHPLPAPETFCATLGRLGIDRKKQVVAYDSTGGAFAARLWWMLRWQGHFNVAVLDGGFPKWLAEKRPVTSEVPRFEPVKFDPEPQDNFVDARYVETHLKKSDMRLIDGRSPERYSGNVEPLDPVGGHIPGALNHFFQNNLDKGCFRSPEDLRRAFLELLDNAPPQNTVHMCGSGVTACQNLLAMEIAGLRGSKLYPGSWSEWCSDPRRPMITP
ncbi:MAG TPA: sulfurtransferase [Burkholderiales bacterium]|nr:sulfurtransferase [Burkholderiales bacterium]